MWSGSGKCGCVVFACQRRAAPGKVSAISIEVILVAMPMASKCVVSDSA